MKLLVSESYNWFGPIAASYYRIHLKAVNNSWRIEEVELLGFS
ncbi:MAG: hypothetical protein ABF652_18550 [Clostridium beijerinckii]